VKRDENGYRSVFKSCSLIGGSQGVCYAIGLVRTKSLAYLLGPEGIGLVSLYTSIIGTVGAFSNLGFSESAVREIVSASNSTNTSKFDRTIAIVRKASLVTGVGGLLLILLIAGYLSKHNFGNSEHKYAIMLLGITLVINAITSSEIAILQGTGRLSVLAKMNIASSIASVVPVVLVYIWWKEQGVVAAFILSSILSAAISLYYSRTVPTNKCRLSLQDYIEGVKPLMSLGIAFMLTGLLWAGKDMLIRTYIIKTLSLESAGLYQSAWAISGLFVNFVLRAMGMDFYPRLTSLVGDNDAMRDAVNQQIEMGVLLALPGVVATITCAPMVILLLYTTKFQSASLLLTIMSCGVFFKVVSYPLNMIQLAKGDAKGFATYGILLGLLETGLTLLLLLKYGLVGAAVAFPVACFTHIFAMVIVGRKSINYRTNRKCVIMVIKSTIFIVCGLLIATLLKGYTGLGVGIVISLIAAIFSLRETSSRLGSDHRMIQMILKLPGTKFLLS
jgi:enterobacterial common antigen flippase